MDLLQRIQVLQNGDRSDPSSRLRAFVKKLRNFYLYMSPGLTSLRQAKLGYCTTNCSVCALYNVDESSTSPVDDLMKSTCILFSSRNVIVA